MTTIRAGPLTGGGGPGQPATAQGGDDGPLDTGQTEPEELADVLRNIRRRYVVYYTKQADGTLALDELVGRIVDWEQTTGGSDLAAGRRKSVRNALVQTHLPKLQRAGLIQYDESTKTVGATDLVDRVEVYPASETHDWEVGYGLLTLTVVVLASVEHAGPPAVGVVATVPWEGGLALAIAVLTLASAYDRRRRRQRFRDDGPDVIVHEPDHV